jgi:3-dehydroquinate synthase
MLSITDTVSATLADVLASTPHEGLFVLADDNTSRHCLPLLTADSNGMSLPAPIVIPAGEAHKNIGTLSTVWEALSQGGATRRSLLLCVGGGVVTDLGGFAAATFKRGIACIHIPTTLLAMVDASVGGKTGIDHGGLKNEVGAFHMPAHVIVSPAFLSTLPRIELLSGMAEMCKHLLIAPDGSASSLRELEDLAALSSAADITSAHIARSIAVKEHYVTSDPTEQGLRRTLNFGHTVGHAIESLMLDKEAAVPHGMAVAWGMVAELFLSHVLCDFPITVLRTAVGVLRQLYGPCPLICNDYDRLYDFALHDKKCITPTELRPALLADIGIPRLDLTVSRDLFFESLDFLREG